ncbi:glucose 1-dehydrogenase [Bacillus sp. DTU_2020_1000418_1_SI_GHA_SEK_038]|uniref:glucose 1-dehydrogenase n=1 Tax=Bacillus sp. DTU_2020_1000418_1_SI_GHA_SEK_038 TaxID=3077585 RepID=UPI0028E8507C|nr:glucose 1-dehydrogenase [Bacillus sp. DTU_2020_1000418_1_SI_GHA_SEK_038]WNS76431.1 glucose 1-dehydrogenase [Bacillus sp. DTU_2020_1000418_1_SI_GHA_SEK_038]
MGRLSGKVVIITGAANGMGETNARMFVKEGAKVVLTDIEVEKGQKVAEELGENAIFIKHDVTNEEDWQAVVDKTENTFGPITGLVNNAGTAGRIVPLEEVTDEDFYRIINLNQYSVFKGMQTVVKSMKKANSGSIVNISSTSGIVGSRNLIPYVASKFAVRGMTKVAALELADFNIRVNSVHPGGINTERAVIFDEVKKATPLGRGGKPEEIAYLVLHLISDESTFTTGSEFVADGGFTAQ